LSPGGSGGGGSGGGFGGRTIAFVILAAILVWFAWGTFYTVQPNEVGINLVFGRYTGKTAAGLNTNWPWPVGTVIHVPVWDQQITEVGYRGDANSADNLAESLMLTGDQNIVNVRFRVIWQIDPAHPEYFVLTFSIPRRRSKRSPRASCAKSSARRPSTAFSPPIARRWSPTCKSACRKCSTIIAPVSWSSRCNCK